MSDRISTFTIAVDGDATDLRSVISSIKTDFARAVTDLQAQTKKVTLFENAQADADKARQALNQATAAVGLYTDQVNAAKKAGTGVSDELAKSLQSATSAAKSAQTAYDRSVSSVNRLSAQLTRAGVDTSRLASEQIRLSVALKQASDAAAVNAAKQQLGIKLIGDVTPTIDRVRAAYTTLANSGQLTQTQLATAWLRQKAAIIEAQSSVTGFREILSTVKVPALAAVAAIAAIGAAVSSTVGKFNEFDDAVRKGGASTNVTNEQLKTLADGARDVAKEFGENAQDAINATFTLIRSGIPADNAIEALRVSAEAAQGGLANLGTTAQLGASILQAYGLKADALPAIFDKIAFASKQGGASIDQLGANIGSLLPIAVSAHIPFDELLASIEVLQKSGLDTGESVSALKKLIAGFADPEVIARLADVGVHMDGLVGTLQQIGKLDPNLTSLRALIPDSKSLAGVAALTKGYEGLGNALDGLREKSDGTAAAQAKIIDATAADKVRKLKAAFDDLEQALGKLAANPALITFLTKIVAGLDNFVTKVDAAKGAVEDYTKSQSTLTILFKAFGDSLVLLYQKLGGAVPAQQAFNKVLDDAATGAAASAAKVQQALGTIASAVADQLAKARSKADDAAKQVGVAARNLAQDVATVQSAMATALKGIDDQSKAAIAALGLQAQTEQQIEDQRTAITIAAAAQRLQVLKDSSAQILTAFDAEAAARLALVQGNAQKTREVEQQLSNDRRAILQQFVDAYRKQVDDLTAQEAGYVQKIKNIDQQRIDFNQSIEDKIAAIRNKGLSAYQAYGNTVTQIETLIQKGREANAQGEFENAEKYINKAIELSDTLGNAVTDNGKEIVSAQSAQLTQQSLLTQARTVFNQSLDISRDKTIANKDATADELKTAQTGLAGAQKALDGIADKYRDGLDVKIDADVTDAVTAVDIFNGYVEDTNRILHVQVDLKTAQQNIDDLQDNLQKGITAGAQQGVTEAVALLKSLESDENDPRIKFLLSDAEKQIDDLGSQIKHLEDLKVAPQVNVATKGVPEAQAALDKLSKDRDMTLTVHVKAVGNTGALGGGGGDGGIDVTAPIGLRRGGIVPAWRRLREFASGGAVFSGRKVPGAGNQDTYRADLQSGSFVVRKAASEYYGDGLLGKLARGATWLQRFAIGGQVGFTFPPKYNGLIQQALGQGLSFDIGGGTAGNEDLADLDDKLQQIIDASTNLTRSQTLPDIGTWASALKERARSLSPAKLPPIRQAIDDNFQLMLDTIAFARQYHVPAVVGPDLFAFLFAKGGAAAGTDRVPALLTPGEWVISRGAVSKYGNSLMNAINSMSIPKAMLANMVRPPQVHRFAAGGQVPGPTLSSTAGAVRESTSNMTVNINGVGLADLFSETNVRRFLMPTMSKIQRRAR